MFICKHKICMCVYPDPVSYGWKNLYIGLQSKRFMDMIMVFVHFLLAIVIFDFPKCVPKLECYIGIHTYGLINMKETLSELMYCITI